MSRKTGGLAIRLATLHRPWIKEHPYIRKFSSASLLDTSMRLLPSVRSLVNRQSALLNETFPTVFEFASVGAFVGMDPIMPIQIGSAIKSLLPTVSSSLLYWGLHTYFGTTSPVASVWASSGVLFHDFHDIHSSAKGLLAFNGNCLLAGM